MKKFLLILFVVALTTNGCKKDTGSNVTLSSTDLGTINGQLKGTWLFPYATVTVVDASGKALSPAQDETAAALQFDGTSNVIIMTNLNTKTNGTYTLSTANGIVYVNIVTPNATIKYQVGSLDGQTLKLSSSQSTVYQDGSNSIPATETTTTTLAKQTAADITANMVRVSIRSDSTFNATVYVSYSVSGRIAPPIALDNVSNISKLYDFDFSATIGDYVGLDVHGDPTGTQLFVYFNGVPVSGAVDISGNKISGSDWYISK